MDKVENIKNLIDYCVEKFDRVPDSVLSATLSVVTAYLQAESSDIPVTTQAIGFEYSNGEDEI